ncbi:MAG: MFS transporter, partial [Planctomycetes bacterium]|nr:MFS transporter [Planctomycetota bacterium]
MSHAVETTDSPDRENGPRPTRTRHFVIGAGALMAALLYLDRFCVGIAEPYIKQDLGLTTMQMGYFFSAFFLTYALCQVPSGWLTDRFGSRLMLVVYVLTWSFFTAMMGMSYGFIMLLLMRAAYGIGQAGAYPTSSSIISKWVPFSNRGKASSVIAVGGRVGGAIAPVLTAFLIVAFVPVSRSSLFEPDDLLQADQLGYEIAPRKKTKKKSGKAKPPSQAELRRNRYWSILSSDSKRIVAEVAGEYAKVAEKIAKLEKQAGQLKKQRDFSGAQSKTEEADQLRLSVDDRQKSQIAGAINELVKSPKFCTRNDETFSDVQLKSAAEKLRARLDAGESLSDDETQRLNRLLLETLYPNALGKVYVAGWRPVMITYGAFGLLIALLLWTTLRN